MYSESDDKNNGDGIRDQSLFSNFCNSYFSLGGGGHRFFFSGTSKGVLKKRGISGQVHTYLISGV